MEDRSTHVMNMLNSSELSAHTNAHVHAAHTHTHTSEQVVVVVEYRAAQKINGNIISKTLSAQIMVLTTT